MKKIFALAAGMIALGSSYAAAQTDAPAIVQRASVMYDLNVLSPKYGEDAYFNGFGVGYTADFRVSNSLPLYVGTGLDLRTVFHSDKIIDTDDYNPADIKFNETLVNLNLPVNVSYRVPVADSFYMTPKVGLDFRVQLYGHGKFTADGGRSEFVDEFLADNSSVDLFSKSDMGDAAYKRFQMGWHAGVDFEYNRVNLGLSYGTDFVKIHKNVGGANFIVSVGYTF